MHQIHRKISNGRLPVKYANFDIFEFLSFASCELTQFCDEQLLREFTLKIPRMHVNQRKLDVSYRRKHRLNVRGGHIALHVVLSLAQDPAATVVLKDD